MKMVLFGIFPMKNIKRYINFCEIFLTAFFLIILERCTLSLQKYLIHFSRHGALTIYKI